jgi:pimeloyl-ACP methyl ester carboxylesterase
LKTFAGGQLFGARYGAAAPWILALPGWERTHGDFDALLRDVDAVALDLPGFGAAAPPPEAWSTEEYAAHVGPVLAEMAPRVVVLGHSFGGRVAVHLGAAHPQQVAGLVLTGVPALAHPGNHRSRRKPPLGLRVAKSLHRAGVIGEERVEELRHKHGSADYRRARGVMRDVLVKSVNESYDGPMAAYPGPIELVWGGDDDQAPVTVAQAAVDAAAAAGRTNVNLTVLAGVGHFVPRDRPDALAEALRRLRP